MNVTFEQFNRIESDPAVLNGKPRVRGTRLSVQRVLEVLAANPSWDELQADYPELTEEDIREVLAFAAMSVADRILPMPPPAA